jgi:hypothetical protein
LEGVQVPTEQTIFLVDAGPKQRPRLRDTYISIPGIATTLDCSEAAVRRLVLKKKLREVEVEGIGRRVPLNDVLALIREKGEETKS